MECGAAPAGGVYPSAEARLTGRGVGPGQPTVWLCKRSWGSITQGETGMFFTTVAADSDFEMQNTRHTRGPHV